MPRFKHLPKNTSRKALLGTVASGFGIGFGLAFQLLVLLYALTGLFGHFFYPHVNFMLNSDDLLVLSLIAVTASTSLVLLSLLAYEMRNLSKEAAAMSRLVFIPLVLTVLLLLWQRTSSQFSVHIGWGWVWWSYEAVILAGIVPALFLYTHTGRSLHNR